MKSNLLRLSLSLASLMGFQLTSLALNLTPLRIMDNSDEGPAQVRYYFQDEQKRLSFRIDSKMTVSGSSDEAVFRFEDIKTGVSKIRKSTLSPKTLFDANGIPSYQAAATALVPPGATNVKPSEPATDTVAINGWKSVQFSFTYQFYGLTYHRSITFINMDADNQVIVDVQAQDKDYDKVYARSYRVLNSIYDLPAEVKPGIS